MSELGYSVYLSNFESVKNSLKTLYNNNNFIFISLHIEEEEQIDYKAKIMEMTKYLKEIGYKILADVSKHSLKMLGYTDLCELVKDLDIDMVRLDYGFEIAEVNELVKEIPICLNASTINKDILDKLNFNGKEIMFIYNFYPHPETAMDRDLYLEINNLLESYHLKSIPFISSDINLRGPINEGLVTIEKHRYKSPYYQFLDYSINYKQDLILVGDSILSKISNNAINRYLKTQVVEIKVHFDEEYKNLYNQVFTIRSDSPKRLKRLEESREYSRKGVPTEPHRATSRYRGSITIDNILYQRYSGEIMICLDDFSCDERVNVIGRVRELEMLDLIKNGVKIKFVRE